MIKRLGLVVLKALAIALIIVICVEQFLFFNSSNNFQPQVFRTLANNYDVEVLRDEWGVPTILGVSNQDVAFGLGYVQAEDRLEDIEQGVINYRGETARYLDRSGTETDWLIQWLGIWDWLAQGDVQQQLSEETRSYLQAYVDGVNAYAGTDVKRATPSLYPLTVDDVLAGFYLQHLMFYGFDEQLSSAIKIDVPPLPKANEVPRGSTAIAVSPSRSNDQSTMLLWNSHQPIRGALAWYEAHLYSEEGWEFHGGFFPGSPVPFIGANAALGWGVTVNKPDLLSVQRVEGASMRSCELSVRIYRALSVPVSEPCYGSPSAPVLKLGDQFFEVNYAGKGQFAHIEQWLDMARAQSIDEWTMAFERGAIPSFNFVVASSNGDIHYRSNAVFSWNDAQADIELPALTNPSSGYIASANQTPYAVSSPLRLSSVPEQTAFETHMTNRAWVIHEYFSEHESVSLLELKELKYDASLAQQSPQMQWIQRLQTAESPTEIVEEARQLILGWDGRFEADSIGSALGACLIESFDPSQVDHLQPDPIARLAFCANILDSRFGRLDLPSTAITRVVDGPNFWSIEGGADVMRAIYADHSDFEAYGLRRVVAGDGLHGFVVWHNGVLSSIEMVSPYGQSIERLTPHRIDQVPLFIEEQLRVIPLTKEGAINRAQTRYRPSLQY